MIHDVVLSPLPRFVNEQGTVSRMLRVTDPWFSKFGEVYFSSVPRGVVKDWRLHTRLTMNLAVPIGRVRFVLFDQRSGSASHGNLMEVDLGDDDYRLLTVPNGIWMSLGSRGDEFALVANCATEVHDPAESQRRAIDDPPTHYEWRL